jgi:Trk K+ transport system NAD-binding subunit
MTKRVLVCGLGRFGLKVVELLCARGADVVVITDIHTRNDRLEAAISTGASIIHGDMRDATVRAQVQLTSLDAAILTAADDATNLEVALELRASEPGIRVVMRTSSERLASHLEREFGIHKVLSPAAVAADAFTDVVIAARAGSEYGKPRRRHRPSLALTPRKRDIVLLGIVLLLVMLTSAIVFHATMQLSWLDSVYFTTTTVTTVGFGDFNLRTAPVPAKLAGIILMLGGVVTIAVFSSLFTNWLLAGGAIVARREAAARRKSGHIVLCGFGTVGRAVTAQLVARGFDVVVIEGSESLVRDTLPVTRAPVISGDATVPAVLMRAGIDRASVLIATTSNDALNLEIGLVAQSLLEEWQEMHPDLPDMPLRMVLRCFDADVAARIAAAGSTYSVLSEAKVAAPVFVSAALD